MPDVVKEGLPLLNRRQDGADVIVHEDHVCSLLAHTRTRTPQRHADLSHLQCRCVIDAVAGHGDNIAPALVRLHDRHFVAGRGTVEHTHVVDAVRKLHLHRYVGVHTYTQLCMQGHVSMVRDR